MTIIAAIKKDNKVLIGCDSFLGNSWVQTKIDNTKIVTFGNCAIGIAGNLSTRDVLEDLSRDPEWNHYWVVDKPSARYLAREIFRRVKESFKDGLEHRADSDFIIATPNDIYKVQSDLSVYIVDKFEVIGAGMYQCMGSLNALYDLVEDPKDILSKALNSTCELNPFCTGPIHTYNLKYDQPVEQTT